MASLRLHFLGPARFERDGAHIELPPAKAVALLAYLAVTRTPQTREHLLDLLWPESFADAARKNLRNTLWTIRKALGDEVLRTIEDRLDIDPATWIDVREFEARAGEQADPSGGIAERRAALDLYGGTLLDGISFADTADFDLWLTTERERLEQLYLHLLASLIETYRRAGDWREVIPPARLALARDNLQEPMYRALMEAHGRLGERPEALRQYDTLRTTLDRELGVEPLPETEALRAAILDGTLQPATAPPASAPAAPIRSGRRPSIPGGPPQAPYIGRQAERAALDAERAMAATGQARVVLLTGEVGIGKSRLWSEWAATLPPDEPVLETRCLEATQSLPFAPLIELFSSRAYASRLFTPPSPVPPIWLAEIARILPEVRTMVPDLPAPAVLPAAEERRRVFEAFVQCVLALGGQPLVFFIDDLHWADNATLDWLGYLVHRMREAALLLVAAYRPEEAPPALIHQIAGWGREGLTRRLALERLTPAESVTLVTELGGDPALAAQVQEQSAGNPYFLIELCQATPGDVPPALAELVRARLDRLPETARQVAQAAAVLEPDFDFPTLRRTSGRGEEETLDALDTLLEAGVLREVGGRYSFNHPFVATVVRDGLSGARRAFIHRRAAEAREAEYAGRLPVIAGRLAAHYEAAGDPARAAAYAEMAAQRALALAAPAEAADFYRQALALEPAPDRQIGLGQALMRQGDMAGARAAYRAARAGFQAAGRRADVARAALSIAETYLPAARPDELLHWVELALPDLDPDADPAAHARAHFLLGAGHLAREDDTAHAERHLNEAADLATANHLPDLAGQSRFELGNLRAQRGDLPGARRAYDEAIAFAQAAGDPFQEVLGHNNAAYHALLAGDLDAAHSHLDTALAMTERSDLRMPRQYLYSTRGELALGEGRPAEAETWFRRGLAEAEYTGNTRQVANYHANLSLARRAQGDLDGALALLEQAQAEAAPLIAPYLQTQIDLWRAELYKVRGEYAAADAALAQATARLANAAHPHLLAWADRLRRKAPSSATAPC
jgi:DNA-binding SARP family transcriptional activator